MADSGYLLDLCLCLVLQEFSDCVYELSLVSVDNIWIYVALCSGSYLNLVDNKITVFWGVSPCSLVDMYQRFFGGEHAGYIFRCRQQFFLWGGT
jgi:hypothetical protein